MRKLIAFTGKTCSGKTTAAKVLVDKCFVQVSCIEPIRLLAANLWEQRRDAIAVKAMCDVGAIIRAIDPALLMRPLCQLVRDFGPDADFVVDDLRMRHEVPILQELGFRIIRVTCPSEVRRQRMFARDGYYPSDEALNAKTETDLDDFDFEEIDGSLPLVQFRREVAGLCG